MKIDKELEETAKYVLNSFRSAKAKISTAESCTGGLISALLTSIPGSSDVFECGFVTYSNEAKTKMLSVPEDLLESEGAVSSQTAMAMALGALDNSNANATLAVTGIAGPDGGSEEKPVGLVYVAVASEEGVFVEELQFGDIGREEIRNQTAQAALEMLVAFTLDGDDEDLPENSELQ